METPAQLHRRVFSLPLTWVAALPAGAPDQRSRSVYLRVEDCDDPAPEPSALIAAAFDARGLESFVPAAIEAASSPAGAPNSVRVAAGDPAFDGPDPVALRIADPQSDAAGLVAPEMAGLVVVGVGPDGLFPSAFRASLSCPPQQKR